MIQTATAELREKSGAGQRRRHGAVVQPGAMARGAMLLVDGLAAQGLSRRPFAPASANMTRHPTIA